jgi:type I restriction enzyme S subunit
MTWPSYPVTTFALVNPRESDVRELPDDTQVSFVPMASVSEETASIESLEVRRLAEVRRGYTRFREDDILFAKITPCMENGKVALAQGLIHGIGFGSTEYHILRARAGVLPKYLYYYLRQPSVRTLARQRMRGAAGQQRVPESFFTEAQLSLTPLSEQSRIVALLDQGDSLRRLHREVDAKANGIIPALFLKMFGDPVTNPKGFRKKPLGNLVRVKSGDFLPAKAMARDGEFPVYGGNGINGYHDSYMFDDRKIVLGRVGVYCGVVHYSEPRAWITDNALYVSEKFEPLEDFYLLAALEHARLNQYAGRAGQPLISGSRIYPVEILVPPEEMQVRFSKSVASLLALDEVRALTSNRIDKLWEALMDRAYSGRLTAKWRTAHMKELLVEITQQARALNLSLPKDFEMPT